MTDRGGGSRLVWFGRLTTRRRLAARGAGLIGPGIGWILVFLVLPSILLALLAFATRDPYGDIEWRFTLGNFERLAGHGVLGWSADYLRIFLRSLWIATATTAISLLLAYPLAFHIAGRSRRGRVLWLGLVIVPMCTSLVVRTYAFELLLSPQLPPARIAAWLGLVEAGRALYPGEGAVLLGMISNALPFAVLPVYTNVEKIDWALVEAARDLYAGPVRTFFRAILPQTWPGLGVAFILTFVPSVGMFVITDRLGGAKSMIVGNLIQQQFGPARDYPFGSAVALVLVLITLAGLFVYRRKAKGMEIL